MIFHSFHTITGFVIVLSLTGKFIIHLYLDHLHNGGLGLNSILIMSLIYLKPYKSTVKSEFNYLRYLCNSFLIVACISLLLNVIFGLLIYVN
jgi:ABC-type glycerol-3-phosphate transport system permease component